MTRADTPLRTRSRGKVNRFEETLSHEFPASPHARPKKCLSQLLGEGANISHKVSIHHGIDSSLHSRLTPHRSRGKPARHIRASVTPNARRVEVRLVRQGSQSRRPLRLVDRFRPSGRVAARRGAASRFRNRRVRFSTSLQFEGQRRAPIASESLDRVLVSRSACGPCWLDLVRRCDTPHALMKSGANET